ncbi:unnamed protein product [Ectocarpus sp. 4 AP-2014]
MERNALRKVETEVLKLRDDLEAQGTPEEKIKSRCEAKRAEMMDTWEKNKATLKR